MKVIRVVFGRSNKWNVNKTDWVLNPDSIPQFISMAEAFFPYVMFIVEHDNNVDKNLITHLYRLPNVKVMSPEDEYVEGIYPDMPEIQPEDLPF